MTVTTGHVVPDLHDGEPFAYQAGRGNPSTRRLVVGHPLVMAAVSARTGKGQAAL
jgi:hypothetical protein